MKNLNVLARDVVTKDDFLVFVEALAHSYVNDPKNWENKTIESYLMALCGWVDDMGGYYKNMGAKEQFDLPNINWKIFADILIAARVYE